MTRTSFVLFMLICAGCSSLRPATENGTGTDGMAAVSTPALPPAQPAQPAQPAEPAMPAEPVRLPAEGGAAPAAAQDVVDPAAPFGVVMAALEKVYFAYDSYAIDSAAGEVLAANAARIGEVAGRKISIQGHCDERGSADYNMALGQKRADAVAKFLITLGVPAGRLESLSFGKENPADPGHDDAALARNRRVEFALK